MTEMRTFVAVPLTDPHKRILHEQTLQWRTTLPFRKWVHQADYHITLKFLGATAPDLLEAISRNLSLIASETASFSLSIGGLGTFGPAQSPSVLWAKLGGQLDKLDDLQGRAENALSQLGFPRENRPYRPHVTIARKYSGNEPLSPDILQTIRLKNKDGQALQWHVPEIVLYQSHLDRNPMYEAVASFALPQAD
ncbi:RNA 2',3'-cyclic phosphodiesterase [Ferviditalea candida]|uniref:RNA 2',3'-cyclic phosphodiesterase n=1 Tax=Ferviditalea candida TaxID=3108399 RepID=A0ABU5ZKL5_9BACL|nr:RNA 2',3'-cyclic phosphodiesterase [Paenibacillaceae bacterium T2]